MNWLDYFDLAQQWAGQGDEAHQRSAINRAYYAMFCSTRDRLQMLGDYTIPESNCSSYSEHKHLWDFCEQDAHRIERRQIGVLGNRLRKARNEADYDTIVFNLPDLLEGAMQDAEELRDSLNSL